MRLRNRLVLYFTGGALGLMAGVMAVVVGGPSRILREQATKRAIALGKSVAAQSYAALQVNDWPDMAQKAAGVAKGEDIESIVILDRDGRVTVDTLHADRVGEVEAGFPEGFPADTVVRVVSSADQGEVVRVLEPVFLDSSRSPDTRLGLIRLDLSLRAIRSQTAVLQYELVGVGILALLLGVGAAHVFARRITKPLDRLVQATIGVADGDLKTTIGIDTRDEIGELARNFDRMTAEILRERQRINDLNTSLEGQVRERTKELVHANTSLEKTNADLGQTLQELRNAQAQLIQSEKMASLGQLVAGVVHEVNNPLNFIYNGIPPLTELIDSIRKATVACNPEPPLDDDFEAADALLRALREGAKRATTIVKDLRSFSRLDESESKTGDVHEGLDTTINLLAHRFRGRVQVSRSYSEIPPFEFYPALLNQVFMNLLSNADDAIAERGEVRIETRLEPPWVVISIADTGTGISKDVLPRIFEPFFSTKDVGKGMGLGLSISYSIIEKHGGTISVESELGRGARFTVRIPFRKQPSAVPSIVPIA
ncbi:MAG: HAMP domain-containing protein [Planctomycetes bacterium]|nr:HAMP domain-containing protein [Planctomycetota bacterium]MBI3845451.1 HAMP domain-containing protein [Planctomycetota bacterium]